MKKKADALQNSLMIDYRCDCWTGYKDVSLRLLSLKTGERFTFICSGEQEAGIIKIIAHRNGQIDERRHEDGGIVMTVSKKTLLQIKGTFLNN